MSKLGYTWYPKDWKTNEKVFNMDLETRGFYRELIDWAFENDNLFDFDVNYWSRLVPHKCKKLLQLLDKLIEIGVVNKDGEKYSIPSVEPRIQLIRGGKKGGETSKPNMKPNIKPYSKPILKPDSNQSKIKEKEIERETEEVFRFEVFYEDYKNDRTYRDTIAAQQHMEPMQIDYAAIQYRDLARKNHNNYKNFNHLRNSFKQWLLAGNIPSKQRVLDHIKRKNWYKDANEKS